MSRPAHITVDLNAIRHNYALAKRLAPQSQALAVIKANAYGHGSIPVAEALAPVADGFAVACLEEALVLREHQIEQRLLLLEGFFESSELALVDLHLLDLVIHSHYQLAALEDYPWRSPVNLWIKVDTGMHRLGFEPQHAAEVIAKLRSLPWVKSVTLMTHLACADEADRTKTEKQLVDFQSVGLGDLPASIANSPGVLAWPVAHRDWIRPGMMLYGASPLEEENAASLSLQPAMTLSSKVIAVKTLQASESIGYGATYTCADKTTIAVVAMGYGDGYPRNAGTGTPILINGERCKLLGRVSMDMLVADISHLADCPIGAPVECWGRTISLKEVALHANTIPYELVTRMPPRAEKTYLG